MALETHEIKLIQHQFLLLLHASNSENDPCRTHRFGYYDDGNSCGVPEGADFRDTLRHIRLCKKMMCAKPWCTSSKQILAYWHLNFPEGKPNPVIERIQNCDDTKIEDDLDMNDIDTISKQVNGMRHLMLYYEIHLYTRHFKVPSIEGMVLPQFDDKPEFKCVWFPPEKYSICDNFVTKFFNHLYNTASTAEVQRMLLNRLKNMSQHKDMEYIVANELADPFFNQVYPLYPICNYIRRCEVRKAEIEARLMSLKQALRESRMTITRPVMTAVSKFMRMRKDGTRKPLWQQY